MIIYERQSLDNTNKIIRSLISEGLPIHLYDDPNVVLEPFAEGNVTNAMAYRAINEYGADLIVPLDTDEFLYHTDGINPRETLEALREDVEYQALWRTYVYEKEPDISLGFMPNNFTRYRNPILEKVQEHAGKTFISRYLITEKKAEFVVGAHWLQYPDENKGTISIENPEKIVCAHFPIRSKEQLMRKTIPNWIHHWHRSSGFPYHFNDGLHQLGILFKELKDNGEFSQERIKDFCIEYSLRNPKNNLSKNDLERIKIELGENLVLNGQINTSFCTDKLVLHYTKFIDENKILILSISTQIEKTVTYLATEVDDKSKVIFETMSKMEMLTTERDELTAERNGLISERDRLLNSRSWRFTKPLRDFANFLRRHKALRLIVKGLLSLKRNGIRGTIKKIITYTYKQIKSMTKLSIAEMNSFSYESEYQENIDFSKYKPKVKAIAFYLPQFHAIPENDKWWGKGFTEWTNTRKAKPKFKGHYQPREPHNDFGYYDLTDIEIIKKQALLAKQHGIYGFCFYFYWFSGKRLLEKPLDLLLEHPEIDINFCLCWANENWTRRWDGLEKKILISQKYTKDDPYKFIEDIQSYLYDKRYIRIDGKPIILVYRPEHINNTREVFNKWRKYAAKIGIGQIQILICNTWGHTAYSLQIEDIIDGVVEFPPHHITRQEIENIHYFKKNGAVYNYKEVVSQIKNDLSSKRKNTDLFQLYRTCMLGWDNAARKRKGWFSFANFSLKSFFEWSSLLVENVIQMQNPLFFVNAWNEWGEGTYLEPDKKYGYANINTLSKALYGLPFNYINPVIYTKYNEINEELMSRDNVKICVQVHLYYLELIDEIISNLNYIPFPFHCYISSDTDEKIDIIKDEFNNKCKNAILIDVRKFENKGRDIAPFLEQMRDDINKFDYLLHIHTKKTITSNGYGDDWRKYLYKYLLGNTENIYYIFNEFFSDEKLGLIFPKTYPPIIEQMVWGTDIEQAKQNVDEVLKKVGVSIELYEKPEFPAGNMFWARIKSIKKMFAANIKQNDFPAEENQHDMTLAHAIERAWVYIAKSEGYTYKQLNNIYLSY
jgi:lipopolysaccharide biosynthesis protein